MSLHDILTTPVLGDRKKQPRLIGPSHLVGWLAAPTEAHLLLKGWKQEQFEALSALPSIPVA